MPGLTYTGQSWLVLRTRALELEQLVLVTKSLRPKTLPREGMALTSGQGWWVGRGVGQVGKSRVRGLSKTCVASPHLAQILAGGSTSWAKGIW